MGRPMSSRAARAVTWIALLLAAGVGLSACGGTHTVRVAGHVLRLRLDEYRILPSSISVPPGLLNIVAYNAGIVTHNVVVERTGRDSSGNAVVLEAISTILPGGQRRLLEPQVLSPGTYTLVSAIANQADLGMVATLTVRPR
jgi:hypothetical protein